MSDPPSHSHSHSAFSDSVSSSTFSFDFDCYCPNLTASLYRSILHSFSTADKQCQAGLQSLLRLVDYLSKVCHAKREYATAILKASEAPAPPSATANETKKVKEKESTASPSSRPDSPDSSVRSRFAFSSCDPSDLMSSFVSASDQLFESLFNESREEDEWARSVQSCVIAPLTEFISRAAAKRSEIAARKSQLDGKLRESQDKLLNKKISCMKLIDKLKQSGERERSEGSLWVAVEEAKSSVQAAFKAKQKEAKKGNFTGFLAKLKIGGKETPAIGGDLLPSETLREMLFEAALDFEAAVRAANSVQRAYYEDEMPELLRAMEALEIARLECLKVHLAILANSRGALLGPANQRAQSLAQAAEQISSSGDVKAFTERIVESVGASELPNDYQYEGLPKPEEIRLPKNEYTTESSERSFFGSSLAECVSLHPQRGAGDSRIPSIFTALLNGLRSLSASDRVGLFRIRAAPEEVKAVKEQFDNGDFTLKTQNPDVLAEVLKDWIRNLSDPLIPTGEYAAATELAKQHSSLFTAPKPAIHILSRIPLVNQLVLQSLCKFLSDIADHGEDYQVTATRLAAIFAPSILRRPEDFDRLSALQNAPYETRFVAAMIHGIGKPSAAQADSEVSPPPLEASSPDPPSAASSSAVPADSLPSGIPNLPRQPSHTHSSVAAVVADLAADSFASERTDFSEYADPFDSAQQTQDSEEADGGI